MTKRKPTIITQKITNDSAVLTLKVDADILDFQGHFPSHPLLPGVTQIDWAFFYGQILLNAHPNFAGMEVIKFQNPILPDSIVELTLCWSEDKQKLQFSYTSENGPHSSGRIKLDTE
ncbi:3-hydroxyacyl-ACP dehydratase [Photobacterium lipolyticum]|uniref:3-hydroxyacyl-ACP dehydratase n=1 Tax=Photobacterium lipolyticum TaxID=266810 RepID=A0A2T3N3D1_9GAMM|nr:3-hydroxyacyl-ACP dehydratase [Photobacterium lipolyticum]PSW06881.1 3-hydroxyacyl-ACP dehydratase [Photobacterium lipolyticum]